MTAWEGILFPDPRGNSDGVGRFAVLRAIDWSSGRIVFSYGWIPAARRF